MMDPDMPQFNAIHPPAGWSQINAAFDVAPLGWGDPIGIQVFYESGQRTVTTGVVVSTHDEWDQAGDGGPDRSFIAIRESDELELVWSDIKVVLVQIPEVVTLGKNDE